MRFGPFRTPSPITALLAGVVALAMISVAPVLPWGAPVALAQQPCGLAGEGDDPGEDGFQIDGQFFSGEYSEPGNDWAQGDSFAGVIQNDGTPHPSFFPALHERDPHWQGSAIDPSTFSGHSNKNNDDISAGAEPWAWSAGNGPQKNDLTDVYAHATMYDVGGGTEVWLYLGALTRAVNGDSHIDFEWNAAGLEQDTGKRPTKGFIYGLGPNAGRTVDVDFIVSVDFTQGGDIPEVTYRRWSDKPGGGFRYEEFTPGPDEAYVCTNVVDIPAPPWGAIAPDGSPATDVVALQFVEMAVNLTALGADPGDLCSATATMLFKTRSSQSFTAELKDYSLHAFPIIPPPDCTIRGPGATCEDGFPVELCGVEPTDGHVYSYTWTGPEWMGPHVTYDRCVEVNQGGMYHLSVTDETTGCSSDTCDYDLEEIPLPPCDIADQSACEGDSVTFCGPDGNYRWTWTYPDASTATTRCITIDPVQTSDFGAYTLMVQDADAIECATECTTHLDVTPGPECTIIPPCGPYACNTSGHQLCGVDMGPGYTYSWELVSSPSGWALVPPLTDRCVIYNTGNHGDATLRLTVTDGQGCSGSCEITLTCTEPGSKDAPRLPGDTDGNARPVVPSAFALYVNTPNPVRDATSIRYAVPEESRVSLTIHNLRGQVVAVLEDGVVGAGVHTRSWHAATDATVASGVYFYRMEATGLATGHVFRQTQKMVVAR